MIAPAFGFAHPERADDGDSSRGGDLSAAHPATRTATALGGASRRSGRTLAP
jgi:hypothetical protein